MWARVVEVMLGCWLAMSPFIFRVPLTDRGVLITDFGTATAVVCFALLSFWKPARRMHLANIAVGSWLVGAALVASNAEPSPADQNHAIVGLLVLMFAVIPTCATEPPDSWKAFQAGTPNRSRD